MAKRLLKWHVNYRLSLLCLELIDVLRARTGHSATAVIETAVRVYAASVIGERAVRKIEKGVKVFGPNILADKKEAAHAQRQ
jgi:hypothetical protein